MKQISVQAEVFDPGTLQAQLEAGDAGAIATFTGLVRGQGGVRSMTLEHYPGMTERALDALADQAMAKWSLDRIILVHRYGELHAGERIVFVGCASSHRAAALDACAFLIDQLKTSAPFWKQEALDDGTSRWVDAREADDAAAARWD